MRAASPLTVVLAAVLSVLATGCLGRSPAASDHAVLAELRRVTSAPADDARLVALVSASRLDRGELIAAVLAGNPGVAAMRAAWRAAASDAEAAGALDDPMVSYELAPLSIGSSAPFGQRVQIRQKLAFPRKRGLAADAAASAARVAHGELRAMRLELAELVSGLYDDYALAEHELAINDHHRRITEQMKRAAEAQLASGRASPQDAIAADVELATMAQERVMIESRRAAVIARLNGLLHRAPDLPLPAPSDPAVAPAEPAALDQLLRGAAERPDAQAAGARIAGHDAEVALAERAFYPDLEVMAGYDAMAEMAEHRWMLGIAIELPVLRGKRAAMRDAARARANAARAELDRLGDDIRVELAQARRDVIESNALVASYQPLVIAVRAQVEAALAGFVTGRNDFTAVITAERSARERELAALAAQAELSKRRAALDRATGRLPGGGTP